MSSPFVYTYRQFPTDDPHNLEKQLVNVAIQYGVAINARTIGTFDTNQVADGERWFAVGNMKLRDGQRKVLQFSSILNGTTTIPHGINVTSLTYVTRLYGTAVKNTTFIPLPFVSVANDFVQLNMDATNVYLTTTSNTYIGYSGTIVVEFL